MIEIKIRKLSNPAKCWWYTHNYEIVIKNGSNSLIYGKKPSLSECLRETEKYRNQVKIEVYH
jgi:hypothetical protein